MASQLCHWIAYSIRPVPTHVPVVATNVCPACGIPLIVGATVLCGPLAPRALGVPAPVARRTETRSAMIAHPATARRLRELPFRRRLIAGARESEIRTMYPLSSRCRTPDYGGPCTASHSPWVIADRDLSPTRRRHNRDTSDRPEDGIMADLGGGVYVSRVDSDEYEPDDEVGGFTAHAVRRTARRRRACGRSGRTSAAGARARAPLRETADRGARRIGADRDPGRADARPESGRHGVDAERRRHGLLTSPTSGGLVQLPDAGLPAHAARTGPDRSTLGATRPGGTA